MSLIDRRRLSIYSGGLYMKRFILLVAAFNWLSGSASAQDTIGGDKPTSPLSAFDGLWRGPATRSTNSGKTVAFTQTERVGSMLDGSVRVIEGHSYNMDGSETGFNALGIVSPVSNGSFEFRTYAQGRAGTFGMKATADSFEWSMPAGPDAVVRFTASVAGGKWHEEGWYERGGKPIAKVFDMTLVRIGNDGWPSARPVPPK